MKQVTGTLRLELAQYRELAAFAQFGTDLDQDAKMRLEKGKRLIQILKQDQYMPMPVEKQVMIFFAGTNNYLTDIPVHQVMRFESEFLEYMDTHHREVGKAIVDNKKLDDELKQQLIEAIEEFKKIFSVKEF
jgi:F-type H+-transporting ATPase subunit alpha